VIREVARTHQADVGLISSALWIQVTLSLAWLIVVGISADVLRGLSPEVVAALQVYSLSLIPLAFFTVFTAVLRAHERMDVYLVLSVVAACVQLGGAWLVLQKPGNLLSLVMMRTSQGSPPYPPACYAAVLYPHSALTGSLRHGNPPRSVSLALCPTQCVCIPSTPGDLDARGIRQRSPAGWLAAPRVDRTGESLLHIAVLGALLPALAQRIGKGLPPNNPGSPPRLRRSLSFLLLFSMLARQSSACCSADRGAAGARYQTLRARANSALSLISYTFCQPVGAFGDAGKEQRLGPLLSASPSLSS
jgi:hypothetical protein